MRVTTRASETRIPISSRFLPHALLATSTIVSSPRMALLQTKALANYEEQQGMPVTLSTCASVLTAMISRV